MALGLAADRDLIRVRLRNLFPRMRFRTSRGCEGATSGYVKLTSSRQIGLTIAAFIFALLLGASGIRALS